MILYKFLFLSIITYTLSACDHYKIAGSNKVDEKHQSAADSLTGVKENQSYPATQPNQLFTLSDAEKIMGEPSHLADSSSTFKAEVTTFSCAYMANTKDEKTGKTGAVYFLFEEYGLVTDAKKKYSFIKEANENHGIKVLHDIGDEAYFHSDGQNFYFVMARKGTRVFNMKVNKITSHTSLDAFNLIAKKITESI